MPRYVRVFASLLLLSGGVSFAQTGLEFAPTLPPSARQSPEAPRAADRGRAAAPEPGGASDRAIDSLSSSPQNYQMASESSELAPGDTLMYSVAEDAGTRYEGTREIRIGADGKIEIPFLGPIQASKKTVRQLQDLIKAGLERDYYQTATVRVSLMSRLSGPNAAMGSVYVQGEVNRPGRVEIPPNETFTLTKAITQAGEFGRFANKKEILLIRKEKDGKVDTQKLNYLDIEEGKAPDVELRHDDTIRVKEKFISFGG